MKPIRLHLTGFLGIRSGLGRDEIEIEIPDAPLVAISGPNGAGKSTLLDNMQPYRLMPSRATDPNPNAFAFYDHTGAEASRVLTWEHGGRTYETRMSWKQTAKTKKGEAVLLVRVGDEWKPAEAVGIISDGRADTYDRLIRAILGPESLYFNTAFFSQGRRSLSAYKPTEVKDLLSDLLGLTKYLDMAETARRVSKSLMFPLPSWRSELAGMDAIAEQMAGAMLDAETAKEAMRLAETARALAREHAAAAARELADAQAAEGNTGEIRRRRNDLEKLKGTLEAREVSLGRELDKAIAMTKARIDSELADNKSQTDAAADGARRHRAEAKAQRERIEITQAKVAECEKKIGPARSTLEALEAELVAASENHEQRAALNTECAAIKGKLSSAKVTGSALAESIKADEQRGELINRVPCSGMAMQDECPLLASAREALTRVEVRFADLVKARDEYKAMSKELEAATAKLVALPADTRAGIEARVRETRNTIAEIERGIQAGVQIEHMKIMVQRDEAHADEMEARAKALIERRATIEAAHDEDREEILKSFQARTEEVRAQLAEVEAEIALLPDVSGSSQIEIAQGALAVAERQLSDAENDVLAIQARIQSATGLVETLRAKIAGRESLSRRVTRIEDESSAWTTLAKALGKDGIVALTIDDAGPTLSNIANDLLDACFGGRFSIELITQAVKADGDMKETFDILVSDSARGDVKPLRAMSGGERVYLNEVLSVAIGLYQSRRSRGAFHTRLCDETDGPLDEGKKLEFAALKRRVLDIGGFEREVFISHSPAVQEAADEVIDLTALAA